MADTDDLSPTNLYDQMERKRERNKGTGIRELYAPYFLAKLLRQYLPHQVPVLSSTVENENNIPFDAKWFNIDPRFNVFHHPVDQQQNGDGTGENPSEFGSHTRQNRSAVEDRIQEAEMEVDNMVQPVLTVSVEETYFMEPNVKKNVDKILRFGQALTSAKILNRSRFCRHFCEEVKSPPLELIWLLSSKYDLLDTSSYLMMLLGKEYYLSSTFAYQYLSFCFSSTLIDPGTRYLGSEILEHFLQALIVADECNSKRSDNLRTVKNYSQDILRRISSKLLEDSSGEQLCEALRTTISALALPHIVKQRYYIHQLDYVLSLKSSLTPADVIQKQEQFAAPDRTPDLKSALIDMLLEHPTSPIQVLELISVKLHNGELVNWENLLLCLTEWEKKYKADTGGVKYLRDNVKKLMYDGFNEHAREKVIAAFIMARHCSLIAPETFFRYERWYNSMFGKDQYASPLRQLPMFNFFTELLTELVPIDPICFLQVHAAYLPYIPPALGCKTIWNEYVQKAKERIQEYQDIEAAMEFEAVASNPLQQEVDRAIKAFATTNKVPPFVMEMSLFRGKYYVDQFLPVLLRKPVGVTHSDARLRLIEILNAQSKMPTEMYSKYRRGGFNQ